MSMRSADHGVALVIAPTSYSYPFDTRNVWFSTNILLGRAGKNSGRPGIRNLFIDCPSLSVEQALFNLEGGEVYVIDPKSASGIYVNGIKIQQNTKVKVEKGTIIAFGDLSLSSDNDTSYVSCIVHSIEITGATKIRSNLNKYHNIDMQKNVAQVSPLREQLIKNIQANLDLMEQLDEMANQTKFIMSSLLRKDIKEEYLLCFYSLFYKSSYSSACNIFTDKNNTACFSNLDYLDNNMLVPYNVTDNIDGSGNEVMNYGGSITNNEEIVNESIIVNTEYAKMGDEELFQYIETQINNVEDIFQYHLNSFLDMKSRFLLIFCFIDCFVFSRGVFREVG